MSAKSAGIGGENQKGERAPITLAWAPEGLIQSDRKFLIMLKEEKLWFTGVLLEI